MVMDLMITKKLKWVPILKYPDTDGDGVIDGNDDLPLDPFGDEDTDGDGIRDGLIPMMIMMVLPMDKKLI